MAEDLQLSTYKIQLQQVDASLTTDPDNEDLLKLKSDLEEVIALTAELVGAKQPAGETIPTAGTSSGSVAESSLPQHTWKSGEKCLAPYAADGQYYEAKVDEILEDGTCTVQFEGYGDVEVTEVSLLKLFDPDNKDGSKGVGGPDAKKSKKDLQAAQREYKKKKSEKKRQRQKQLEEEREAEKNKWIDFNVKTFSKTNKGRVKKSIFATPDAVNGKVGVGTCGKGGRPMTHFAHHEKWKK